MACPHVAGVAALWAEKLGIRGPALAAQLVNSAVNIGGLPRDIGGGLVSAP